MHRLFGAGTALFVLAACSPQPAGEANQAAGPTPVAAEANLTNSGESASAEERETNDREPQVTAEKQPGSSAPAGAAPSYDIQAYCATVSDAVGGSYVIEKGCRDQEQDALAEIRGREIPARVARYCDEVAEAVGGSYVIFNGCVDQELGAAAEL
jgi:hypothetical protein